MRQHHPHPSHGLGRHFNRAWDLFLAGAFEMIAVQQAGIESARTMCKCSVKKETDCMDRSFRFAGAFSHLFYIILPFELDVTSTALRECT